MRLKFEGNCLKQEDKAPYTPNNEVNLFNVYEVDTWSRDLNTDSSLQDCLLGPVKLTKNVDPDKYKYNSCSVGFGSGSEFSLTDGSMGKNAIIFGVDMS